MATHRHVGASYFDDNTHTLSAAAYTEREPSAAAAALYGGDCTACFRFGIMSRTTTTARRRIGAKGVSVDVADQTRQRARTGTLFFSFFFLSLAPANARVTRVYAPRASVRLALLKPGIIMRRYRLSYRLSNCSVDRDVLNGDRDKVNEP